MFEWKVVHEDPNPFDLGLSFAVSLSCKYSAPLRLDDEGLLTVTMLVTQDKAANPKITELSLEVFVDDLKSLQLMQQGNLRAISGRGLTLPIDTTGEVSFPFKVSAKTKASGEVLVVYEGYSMAIIEFTIT